MHFFHILFIFSVSLVFRLKSQDFPWPDIISPATSISSGTLSPLCPIVSYRLTEEYN